MAFFVNSQGVPMEHPMTGGGTREFQQPLPQPGAGMNPMMLLAGLKFLQGLAPQGSVPQQQAPQPYRPQPFTGALAMPSPARRG